MRNISLDGSPFRQSHRRPRTADRSGQPRCFGHQQVNAAGHHGHSLAEMSVCPTVTLEVVAQFYLSCRINFVYEFE
jgi:hypothetical protein